MRLAITCPHPRRRTRADARHRPFSWTWSFDWEARSGARRRAGRDIYAITAPLVVEATERILDGRIATYGTAAPGEIFAARDFLEALEVEDFSVGLG
jgi:hypothetical protein